MNKWTDDDAELMNRYHMVVARARNSLKESEHALKKDYLTGKSAVIAVLEADLYEAALEIERLKATTIPAPKYKKGDRVKVGNEVYTVRNHEAVWTASTQQWRYEMAGHFGSVFIAYETEMEAIS